MYLRMGLSARWLINISGQMRTDLRKQVFNIHNENDFLETALELFNFQYDNNAVYQAFIKALGKNPDSVKTLEDIPFLPVEFFRNHKVVTGDFQEEKVFQSSGTTGVTPGKHWVYDLSLYEESFFKTFRLFYGDPKGYLIVALLPSYTEREGSSLVYMADKLIRSSMNPDSGFYKADDENLIEKISTFKNNKQKVLLLGVSFALLDLAEKCTSDLSGVTVMETGGMKGRRKELIRSELHAVLKGKFNVPAIHSEYGMTELMSQAYSKGDGVFYSPPWMKVLLRDPQDPLSVYTGTNRTGGINIIDLANINSCSFISTGDLGKIHADGGFEVLGRFDNSDIRGCNLMVE
jgi:phenylacetate-coenzyme A ligase PaaK-like adenylate-forming protein